MKEHFFTFNFKNDKNKEDIKKVIEKFDNNCEPRKNTTIIRNTCFTFKQTNNQRFDDYMIELYQRFLSTCK